MSADDRPSIAQSIVSKIEVSKFIKKSSHNFDSDRVNISFRSPAVGLYFKKAARPRDGSGHRRRRV
jgi:hypothetical protein